MSKEKRTEKIQDALCYLDDEWIEEVDRLRGFAEIDGLDDGKYAVKKNWKRWTALAACICVLCIGNEECLKEQDSILDEVNCQLGNQADTVDLENYKKGVYIPKMKVNISKSDNISEDMLGFFILNGHSYIQYEFYWNYENQVVDFVGDYVGNIAGTIDEWTTSDAYVEGTGTYTGKVYEVKGVSPEFMLCMVWEDGSVETFINHNDITLYKGSDLIDNWLDLRGNYNGIAIETIQDSQFTYEDLGLTEEELQVFDHFLDVFAEGDYVYVKEKVEHPFGGDKDTSDMMEFYFIKENGVRLRFRTLGDGYVSFPWIDACVKMDQSIYDEVVKILHEYVK